MYKAQPGTELSIQRYTNTHRDGRERESERGEERRGERERERKKRGRNTLYINIDKLKSTD